VNNQITKYIVQITDTFGHYQDELSYPTLEMAQKALPFWLNDYKKSRRFGRIIKETRELVEGSTAFNKDCI